MMTKLILMLTIPMEINDKANIDVDNTDGGEVDII